MIEWVVKMFMLRCSIEITACAAGRRSSRSGVSERPTTSNAPTRSVPANQTLPTKLWKPPTTLAFNSQLFPGFRSPSSLIESHLPYPLSPYLLSPHLLSPHVSSSKTDVRVLVDFDGTIVPGDVTDHIMASFADPSWLTLEAEFQRGRMGARTCMAAQVELLRATPSDIARAVNERDMDPDFPRFVAECRKRGIGVTVVSDGFGLAIETMLQRHNLDLPYYANHLEYLGQQRWQLGFPNRGTSCLTEAGNCKCDQLAASPMRTVVIGDGRSDFCVATRADFVLSKSKLTDHCRELGLHHWPVTGFDDVVARFDGWLAEAQHDDKRPNNIGQSRPLHPSPRIPAPSVTSTQTELAG
jgi:2-hydroxy-3-keto-5-methylthiopentenyl-1-phosphate phosphatase